MKGFEPGKAGLPAFVDTAKETLECLVQSLQACALDDATAVLAGFRVFSYLGKRLDLVLCAYRLARILVSFYALLQGRIEQKFQEKLQALMRGFGKFARVRVSA